MLKTGVNFTSVSCFGANCTEPLKNGFHTDVLRCFFLWRHGPEDDNARHEPQNSVWEFAASSGLFRGQFLQRAGFPAQARNFSSECGDVKLDLRLFGLIS